MEKNSDPNGLFAFQNINNYFESTLRTILKAQKHFMCFFSDIVIRCKKYSSFYALIRNKIKNYYRFFRHSRIGNIFCQIVWDFVVTKITSNIGHAFFSVNQLYFGVKIFFC